jgi:hypothetical protein
MSVIINASTTSGLVMTSDLSGSLQFQNNGVNLPMGGVAPAFSAYLATSNQSITTSTFTKIQCQTEDFDTNSNYDNATNYRFTPTVAGYYQVSASVSFQGSTTCTRYLATIYKNGSEYIRFGDFAGTGVGVSTQGSCLIYCNGSTDYLELYCYATGTGLIAAFGRNQTNFQACLVRGA